MEEGSLRADSVIARRWPPPAAFRRLQDVLQRRNAAGGGQRRAITESALSEPSSILSSSSNSSLPDPENRLYWASSHADRDVRQAYNGIVANLVVAVVEGLSQSVDRALRSCVHQRGGGGARTGSFPCLSRVARVGTASGFFTPTEMPLSRFWVVSEGGPSAGRSKASAASCSPEMSFRSSMAATAPSRSVGSYRREALLKLTARAEGCSFQGFTKHEDCLPFLIRRGLRRLDHRPYACRQPVKERAPSAAAAGIPTTDG